MIGSVTAVLLGPIAYAADPTADSAPSGQAEAWRTSPYHRALNGSGKPIPCLCRHSGRTYNLGDKVCLQMPNGVVMARCDLFLNNTSWIATDEACTMSGIAGPVRTAQSVAKHF